MLRLGTRASALARWQADWVAAQLRDAGHNVEIVEILTKGDARQSESVADIGAPGVFTKEIQRAVLVGEVDAAVHSLKDLPTDVAAGLMLAAVPRRESPADVLVARSGGALDQLPWAARVGTGSLRRQAQLRHARGDLQIEYIRGNVDTRLRKLEEGEFAAIVLAEAGLKRLGLAARITQVLPLELMLPAVGQGALGLECRTEDNATRTALQSIDDANSHAAVISERALLAHLRGGCLAPIGAYGRMEGGRLQLDAVVLSENGECRLSARGEAPLSGAVELGHCVAAALLDQGAAKLIVESRS